MTFLRSARQTHPMAALFAALPLLAVPLTAQDARQTLTGREVAVFNVAGEVRVEAGSGSDVTVDITRGGRDASKLRVAVDEIRGRRTLRVVYPDDDIVYRGGRDDRWGNSSSEFRINDDGTWGDRWSGRGRRVRVKSSGSGIEAWADLVIRVPAGKTLAVYQGVGQVTATDVDADLRLDAASARISANGIKGALTIDGGSGGVEVRNMSGPSLSVDNGSGGVTVNDVRSDRCSIDTGSGGVRGAGVECQSLTVDVGSGSVRLDGVRAAEVSVDAGSGSVDVAMLRAPRSVMVDAGSGGVTLALPEGTGADVDISTGSGGISSDFPVRTKRVERGELRGTLGDGGGRIRIETGSGSVRLRKSMR